MSETNYQDLAQTKQGVKNNQVTVKYFVCRLLRGFSIACGVKAESLLQVEQPKTETDKIQQH